MAITFFGFALVDSMFDGTCVIERRPLSIEEVKALVHQNVTSCLSPSHKATIDAMRARFGIDILIPNAPPSVVVEVGDAVVVMGVRGLPRLIDRHEYSKDEIAKATFVFTEYRVVAT